GRGARAAGRLRLRGTACRPGAAAGRLGPPRPVRRGGPAPGSLRLALAGGSGEGRRRARPSSAGGGRRWARAAAGVRHPGLRLARLRKAYRMSMNGAAMLAWCRSRPGVIEELPFGPDTRVFKVGGKMFAVCPAVPAPDRVSLKCDPGFAQRLRADHHGITAVYHMNKRHWNTVSLDGKLPFEL